MTPAFPTYPSGLHRRIVLQPGPRTESAGWIGGALEDDMHRFHIRLDHAEGRVTRVAAEAVRHPWSACPGATQFITKELTGERLTDVGARDPAQHCTHLYDLAILAAAHAEDTAPTRFDMTVADRVEGRTTATLYANGIEKLSWQLDGTTIHSTANSDPGRDLRRLSQWKRALSPQEAEWATLLRRAIFVSGARAYVAPSLEQTAALNQGRMGVCFNYQLPQAESSTRTPNWHRDFSQSGHEPLEGFVPTRAFAVM